LEEDVKGGRVRGERLVGGDEMLDEMTVRRREAYGAQEDGARGAGVADCGKVGSDSKAPEEVWVWMLLGAIGEEQEEREEEDSEVRVGGEERESEEEVDREEVGKEWERRQRGGVGRGEHGGGKAASEVVVGRRVRAGRVVVRERAGRCSGLYILGGCWRRAAMAATARGRGGVGCGGCGVLTAAGGLVRGTERISASLRLRR
jgi:hypothetical protein